MTGQAMGRTIAFTVVGCVVAVAAVVAQQDAFKKGMDERKAKRWAMAASALREAIGVDAAESAKKVNRAFGLGNIGVGGDEYLPFFFLGDSLFNIGDCTGALNAWEESDRPGQQRADDRERIQGMRGTRIPSTAEICQGIAACAGGGWCRQRCRSAPDRLRLHSLYAHHSGVS